MTTERIDIKLLGRTIGTAAGWDGDPGELTWYYDFQPKNGIDLLKGDLAFHETDRLIGDLNPESGEFVDSRDVVQFMSAIPRDAT